MTPGDRRGDEGREKIGMAVADDEDTTQAAVPEKTLSEEETRRWIATSHDKFVRDWATREAVAREEGRREGLEEARRANEALRHRAIRLRVAEGISVEQVASIFSMTPDEVTAVLGAG